MKTLGTWWNDKNIEIVEIEGKAIALYGWNGERYLYCFEVDGEHLMDIVDKDTIYEVEPIDEPIDYDEDGEPCQWEVVDYKIIRADHK